MFHPAGSLGKKLVTVDKLMRPVSRAHTARPGWTVARMLEVVSNSPYRSGAALVTDGRDRLLGIFTDADLRRHLTRGGNDVLRKTVAQVMVKNPKHMVNGQPAVEAAALMKEFQIDDSPVEDEDAPTSPVFGERAVINLIDDDDEYLE